MAETTPPDSKPSERDAAGRFVAGHKSQGGRPKGSKSRYSRAEAEKRAEYLALLDEHSPQVLKKLVELAKAGELQAIKMIVDRILPIQTLVAQELQEQIEELREQLECYRRSTH